MDFLFIKLEIDYTKLWVNWLNLDILQMLYLLQSLLESAAFSTLSARKGNFDQSSPVYSRLLGLNIFIAKMKAEAAGSTYPLDPSTKTTRPPGRLVSGFSMSAFHPDLRPLHLLRNLPR